MKFIQFFDYDLSGKLAEPCGDRSVVVIDGRLSSRNVGIIAERECAARKYVAWQVFSGSTFTRCTAISSINYLHKSEPVRNPVWLSAHD